MTAHYREKLEKMTTEELLQESNEALKAAKVLIKDIETFVNLNKENMFESEKGISTYKDLREKLCEAEMRADDILYVTTRRVNDFVKI